MRASPEIATRERSGRGYHGVRACATEREFAYVQVGLVPDAQLGSRKASARRTPAGASPSVGCALPEQGSNGSGEQVNLSRLFHCSIFSCSEKTAPEEQAGAARSTDRRETRGMSLICQCTIRSGVLNRECPWMRPVLQSGHGVAAARQGIGRATRIGPSDRSQVVAGWKKGRSEFLILAMSPFLLPDQQGDRRPPVHLSAQPLSTGGCGRVCLGFWVLDL